MKIIRINVDRSARAHDAAEVMAEMIKADIILYQEPNNATVKRKGMLCDLNMDIAIQCINPNIGIRNHKCKSGYIKLTFREFTMYNCYILPNISVQTFKDYVNAVMEDIRTNKCEAIIEGDLNAKSYLRSPGVQGERGEYLLEWMHSLNMIPRTMVEHLCLSETRVHHILM